ncbi:MAG: M48 family metallopeptidase [Thermoflavifilum sp.]|nr:M48 family metallopeptidase [Thermoflavifilum sp.]
MKRKNNQPCSVNLDGRTVSFSIRVSDRAKNLRLQVAIGTGLEVIVPKQFDLERLKSIIKGKQNWILDKLDYFKQVTEKSSRNCSEPRLAMFLGKEYTIESIHRPGETPEVLPDGEKLVIRLPAAGRGAERTLLERWYRLKAREIITGRVRVISEELNLSYNRIFIKNQKTRWGSCSGLKNLNFNWRLVMAPLPVIDYIVLHELLHLKEPNHSTRFWSLVEKYCPEYRNFKKWLRDNGHRLMF